jgi:transcriptional regulator with XRE-family HTH domain
VNDLDTVADHPEIFGLLLRALRRRRGLTCAQRAAELGMSAADYSRLENGKSSAARRKRIATEPLP